MPRAGLATSSAGRLTGAEFNELFGAGIWTREKDFALRSASTSFGLSTISFGSGIPNSSMLSSAISASGFIWKALNKKGVWKYYILSNPST